MCVIKNSEFTGFDWGVRNGSNISQMQGSIGAIIMSIRCILGDIRLWIGGTSTSSCLVCS